MEIKCLIAVDMNYYINLIKIVDEETEENYGVIEAIKEAVLDKHDRYDIDELPGIYYCDIKADFFTCNHPLDPEEWDYEVDFLNFERIYIKS